jgi:hypothetical protein
MKIKQPRPSRAAASATSRLALTINQTTYLVLCLPCESDFANRAYRLIKSDGAVYDLAETKYGPQCDCPDYIFRRDGLDPDGCKHVKALVRHGLIQGRSVL